MPASKTDGAVCGFFLVACVGGGGWDGELGWVGGLVGVGTWLGVGVHMAKTWATHASRGFGGPHASTPGSEGSPSDLGMGSGAKFTCGGLC